ncbi:MAG TPA: hypothetical protein DCL75_07870 [Ktedonobacter sp.]|nr:hypothetical protein [Ktedonobacter sp.]
MIKSFTGNKFMKKHNAWQTLFVLLLLSLSLQSCLGASDTSSSTNYKKINTGNNQSIGINNQALFKGKIYFTQGGHLYIIDGSRTISALIHDGNNIRDPAVSPDGKWLAFIVRYYDFSDLVTMPITGGKWTIVVDGVGRFVPNPGFAPKSTHNWVFQAAWSKDSQSLIFLSDLQKLYDWANYPYGDLGTDFDQSPFLDLQVFSVPLHNPPPRAEIENHRVVAYASYGDGGNRDPSYRPGHTDQIIYTRYGYDSTRTQQVIQIYMEDPTMIARHPERHYHPGDPGAGYDPGIAITPPSTAKTTSENMQPAFSPDGKEIAYIRRIDTTHMGLYMMQTPENITSDPNNPAVEKRALLPYQKSSLIVSGEFVSQPVWSPDGKQISYVSFNNNEFNIWLANVSVDAKTGTYKLTGNPVPLTSGGIDADSRPFWTS